MISLYIYSILITMVAFILIWILYQSNEEIKNLKKTSEWTINYIRKFYEGNIEYYDEKIKQCENQICEDTDLINKLRKEYQRLKDSKW